MHLIRYEILVSPGNKDVVHHVVVHECPNDLVLNENTTSAHECGPAQFPEHFGKCLSSTLVAVWVI
jgi:hypothetical protein